MSQRKKEALTNGTAPDSTTGKYHFIARLLPPWKWLTLGVAVMSLLGLGVMAQNGWLDGRNRLFGKVTEPSPPRQTAVRNTTSGSALNPLPAAPPSAPTSATPQLSKEYIFAGSRLLSVEDAGATNAPPADLAVWRPGTTGTWYVLAGSSNVTIQNWGTTGDLPAPGDYDGDGKTDFAIFRPSTGEWWMLKSSDGNYTTSQPFGNSTYQLAQADYDGDGKTDIAVFQNGNWVVLRSSDGMLYAPQFGVAGDQPAPADYDGDGLADVGVWRSSDNTFYSINSSNGVVPQVVMGQSSTEPVCGDYDGDGKADYAIRNGANWIIKTSPTGSLQTIGWQQADDQAVQNDYDGDGKVDIAVWRPSNGTWYIRQSHDNSTRTVQWGSPGDTPVPAYYRR